MISIDEVLLLLCTATTKSPGFTATFTRARHTASSTERMETRIAVSANAWAVTDLSADAPWAGGDGSMSWLMSSSLRLPLDQNPAIRLTDPSWFVSRRDVMSLSTEEHEGREVIKCVSRPRIAWGPDLFEEAVLSVDRQYGLVLDLQQDVGGRFRNEEKLTSISFDEDQSPESSIFSPPQGAKLSSRFGAPISPKTGGRSASRLARAAPHLLTGLRIVIAGR